jgi:hypothetical protein
MTDLGLNKHPDGSTTIKVAKWFVGVLFPRSYKESSRFSRKDDPKGAKNGIKKEKEFCNYLFMRLLQNSLVPGTETP